MVLLKNKIKCTRVCIWMCQDTAEEACSASRYNFALTCFVWIGMLYEYGNNFLVTCLCVETPF